jgi:hypothetical protein
MVDGYGTLDLLAGHTRASSPCVQCLQCQQQSRLSALLSFNYSHLHWWHFPYMILLDHYFLGSECQVVHLQFSMCFFLATIIQMAAHNNCFIITKASARLRHFYRCLSGYNDCFPWSYIIQSYRHTAGHLYDRLLFCDFICLDKPWSNAFQKPFMTYSHQHAWSQYFSICLLSLLAAAGKDKVNQTFPIGQLNVVNHQ